MSHLFPGCSLFIFIDLAICDLWRSCQRFYKPQSESRPALTRYAVGRFCRQEREREQQEREREQQERDRSRELELHRERELEREREMEMKRELPEDMSPPNKRPKSEDEENKLESMPHTKMSISSKGKPMCHSKLFVFLIRASLNSQLNEL